MTDTIEKLGKLIEEGEGRDAIHIAVTPVVSASDLALAPAQPLSFDGDTEHVKAAASDAVGIVDPFLRGHVLKGQRFWMFLYPATITSLRHVWTHPAFEGIESASSQSTKATSEAWLRTFIAESDCPGYDALIAAAIGDHDFNTRPKDDPDGYHGYFNSRNDGEYLHFGGQDAHGEIPPEFWHHVEIVTGVKIPNNDRARYFSCSC